MSRQFESVSSRFGAPMGRSEIHTDFMAKARCFRVRMVDHDYDDGGAYWGGYPSKPLFCATNGNGLMMFERAGSRVMAKQAIQERAKREHQCDIKWVN